MLLNKVAAVFDAAHADPGHLITLNDGSQVTAARVLADTDHITFVVVSPGDLAAGDTGARTSFGMYGFPGTPSDPVIFIDPSNQNILRYNGTDAGTNYLVFHEWGHALDQLQGIPASEPGADFNGSQLADWLHLPFSPNG